MVDWPSLPLKQKHEAFFLPATATLCFDVRERRRMRRRRTGGQEDRTVEEEEEGGWERRGGEGRREDEELKARTGSRKRKHEMRTRVAHRG